MKTVFVIRHSAQNEIKDVREHDKILLNDIGKKTAINLGKRLFEEFGTIKIFSSPVRRCIQTGECINKAFSKKSEIRIIKELGNPFAEEGCKSYYALGAKGAVIRHENGIGMSDVRSEIEGTQILMNIIKNEISKDKSSDNALIFITHDACIAPCMNFFLGECFDNNHRIEFLSGLKFQFDDNIMNVSRWNGENQSEIHHKKAIKMGKLIYDKGYNAGNGGNLSIRVNTNHILITAGGALLGSLKKSDLILIDTQGNIIEAADNKKPSSEMIMHLGIYKERPDVNAIIHAHAPYSISLSMLDIDTEKNIYHVSCGPIPITEIAIPSCNDSWEKIKPFVKNRSKVILKRHGAVSWGKDLDTAFIKLEEAEHFAKTLVQAAAVKPIYPIDDKTKEKLFKIWNIK